MTAAMRLLYAEHCPAGVLDEDEGTGSKDAEQGMVSA
jgi:hypothetical protein